MFKKIVRAKAVGVCLGFSVASFSPQVLALGECGYSCCIGGTSTSGVTLAKHLGISIQYEMMDMTTLRHGQDEISPDAVSDRFWTSGASYAVPTKMTMERLSLVMAKPLNERWQILGILPYVRNNMDMRRKMPSGMQMEMTMNEVSGLGDMTILGLYTAYTDAPIRPKHRLSIGFGIKTPTGKNDVRTASGALVHTMMQPGSGSWDPIITVNYLRAWYPLITQVNLMYHYTTEGDMGYEYGDQLSIDLNARYQVSATTNLGLALNAIHARGDVDHDGNYSSPATSMLDNTEHTGLTSVLLSPSIQYKIPGTGGNIELKYQVPIHQDVQGYQQVVDNRWLATLSWAW